MPTPARSLATPCASANRSTAEHASVSTNTADVRERLEAFVAAESECCPFLTMNLQAADGRLRLEVTGPELAGPIIEELFT